MQQQPQPVLLKPSVKTASFQCVKVLTWQKAERLLRHVSILEFPPSLEKVSFNHRDARQF